VITACVLQTLFVFSFLPCWLNLLKIADNDVFSLTEHKVFMVSNCDWPFVCLVSSIMDWPFCVIIFTWTFPPETPYKILTKHHRNAPLILCYQMSSMSPIGHAKQLSYITEKGLVFLNAVGTLKEAYAGIRYLTVHLMKFLYCVVLVYTARSSSIVFS